MLQTHHLPYTYAWSVMTDCNTPQEQIHGDLTLDEAVRLYRRLGITKDAIATVVFGSGVTTLKMPEGSRPSSAAKNRYCHSLQTCPLESANTSVDRTSYDKVK